MHWDTVCRSSDSRSLGPLVHYSSHPSSGKITSKQRRFSLQLQPLAWPWSHQTHTIYHPLDSCKKLQRKKITFTTIQTSLPFFYCLNWYNEIIIHLYNGRPACCHNDLGHHWAHKPFLFHLHHCNVASQHAVTCRGLWQGSPPGYSAWFCVGQP